MALPKVGYNIELSAFKGETKPQVLVEEVYKGDSC